MDLVEEGSNFVTLYSVQEVEEKGSEDIQLQDLHISRTNNHLEDEVKKYKDWIQNTFYNYWDSKTNVETEEDQDDDQYYEDLEQEKELKGEEIESDEEQDSFMEPTEKTDQKKIQNTSRTQMNIMVEKRPA